MLFRKAPWAALSLLALSGDARNLRRQESVLPPPGVDSTITTSITSINTVTSCGPEVTDCPAGIPTETAAPPALAPGNETIAEPPVDNPAAPSAPPALSTIPESLLSPTASDAASIPAGAPIVDSKFNSADEETATNMSN
jgi:hypothetical protein